ncbi:hypothetical protein [Tannockella kyphosi]|uniref:hypothetical protein n=1 Tax=Tannockella kyphosi TaxID=2899121 RepID=UPI0020132DC2|nr:hypothetical protein [Tannockella kyphosi]
MNKKSTIFMELGTVLGMAIALVFTIIFVYIIKQYTNTVPFLFIGFAIIGRVIGYGLDTIVNKSNNH